MNSPSTPGPVAPVYETATTSSGVKWLVVETEGGRYGIWRSQGVHQKWESTAGTLAAAKKRADDKLTFARTFGALRSAKESRR